MGLIIRLFLVQDGYFPYYWALSDFSMQVPCYPSIQVCRHYKNVEHL